MLIVCTKCASAYDIASQMLGDYGRDVKCETCGNVWFARTEARTHDAFAPVAAPPALSSYRHEHAPVIAAEVSSARSGADLYDDLYGAPARTPPPPRRAWPRPNPYVAAAVFGIAALMAAIAGRESIVKSLPGSAGLYSAVGLPVNLRGIAIVSVKSTLSDEPAGRVLAIEGNLSNIRKGDVKIPGVIVSLRGEDGRELYTWTAAAPKQNLGAGETIIFRTRLAAPPDNAREVVLRFAAAESETAKPRAAK